jgi:hypothetical protein
VFVFAFVVAVVLGVVIGNRQLGDKTTLGLSFLAGLVTSVSFTLLSHWLAPPNRIRFPLSEDLKLVPVEAAIYGFIILVCALLRRGFKRKPDA